MTKTLTRLALLLAGASLTCLTPATAFNLDDQDATETSIRSLPEELLPLIVGQLPRDDFFRAGEVCNAWQNARQKILPDLVKQEGHLILHDKPGISQDLQSPVLTDALETLLHRDGFVFVPFGYEHFCAHFLCDQDIEDILPKLYAHAFGEEITLLSHQDRLCLEAVLPWSRLAVADNEVARKNALAFLLTTSPNPTLVRFSPDLDPNAFIRIPHTFVLTTNDFHENKNSLEKFLRLHPNHRLHLVAEEGHQVIKGCFNIGIRLLTSRDVTISDPQKNVRSLGEDFLEGALLQSLCLRLPALASIRTGFLGWSRTQTLCLDLPLLSSVVNFFIAHAQMGSLRLDFPSLTTIGSSFIYDAQARALRLNFPALLSVERAFLYAARMDSLRFDFPSVTDIKGLFLYEAQIGSPLTLDLPALSSLGPYFLRNTQVEVLRLSLPKVTDTEDKFVSNCAHLEELHLQNLGGVTRIGQGAFAGCDALSDPSRQELAALYHAVANKPQGYIAPADPLDFDPSI
ncbi:MAG: hypothetical protein ACK5TR_07465 [Alphaproteobacteria bacterium]|jgi:hypothetical protein|nr:F-box protein [Alphaproteobacteria bacterium]